MIVDDSPPVATLERGSRPRAHTRLYRDGVRVLQDFPLADISEHLAEAGSVVWLDLSRPTPADFAPASAEFGLHELAVEDALDESQRPKLDRYATHLFLSAYGDRRYRPYSGGRSRCARTSSSYAG